MVFIMWLVFGLNKPAGLCNIFIRYVQMCLEYPFLGDYASEIFKKNKNNPASEAL
jgi:hypothetical protein